jgi:acyl dehydratase
MPDDSTLPVLPPMSATTLLRALFKRPTPGAIGRLAAPPPVTHYRLGHIDAGHVARYREALGFQGGHVPLTYYYLLAQRAHLATEVQTGAPAPNGAVHAALDTRATQDGELVFACRSTYLVVRGARSKGERTATAAAPPAAPLASWPLAPASGRAYAALSGDWNPIHLWGWSARLMGLKTPIIHGMHTLGRSCAELERAGRGRVMRLDGRFRAPVALGSSVVLGADLASGRYTVEAAGRVAVEGEFAFA